MRQDKRRGMRSGGWEGGSISWVQMPPCLEHLGQLDFPLLLGIIACFRLLGSPSRTEPQLSLCRFKMGFCHHPSVGSQGNVPWGGAWHSSSACWYFQKHLDLARTLTSGGPPTLVRRPEPSRVCCGGEFELSPPICCRMLGHLQVMPQLPQASVCLSGPEEPQPRVLSADSVAQFR